MKKYKQFLASIKQCDDAALYVKLLELIEVTQVLADNYRPTKCYFLLKEKYLTNKQIDILFDYAVRIYNIIDETPYSIAGTGVWKKDLSGKTPLSRDEQRAIEIKNNDAIYRKSLTSIEKVLYILQAIHDEFFERKKSKLTFCDWIDMVKSNLFFMFHDHEGNFESTKSKEDYEFLLKKLDFCKKYIENNDSFMILNSSFTLGKEIEKIRMKPINELAKKAAKKSAQLYERNRPGTIQGIKDYFGVKKLLNSGNFKKKTEAFEEYAKKEYSVAFTKNSMQILDKIKDNYYKNKKIFEKK